MRLTGENSSRIPISRSATEQMEIDMTKQMNAAAVAKIRRDMDTAKTAKSARKAMAKLALTRNNLTDCGRAEWQKELI